MRFDRIFFIHYSRHPQGADNLYKMAKLNCSESVAPRRNIDAIQDDDIQRRYNAVLVQMLIV
jgi:hypothetical protein